jgi:hypothetical protein
MVAVGLFAETV